MGLLEVWGRRAAGWGGNKLYGKPKRHCFDEKKKLLNNSIQGEPIDLLVPI